MSGWGRKVGGLCGVGVFPDGGVGEVTERWV